FFSSRPPWISRPQVAISTMKDVTASVFGLLIAYVLPGFVALCGLTIFFSLTCLALSLVLGAVRYYLFEKWLCSSEHFDRNVYAKLRTMDGLFAFRQAIDEHYRYYQFHGGLALGLPILFLGLLFSLRGGLTLWTAFFGVLTFAAVETL